jgi:ribonuclease HIII
LTIDVGINVPVGAASADVDEALADIAAAFGQQWVEDLAKAGDLTA